MSAGLRRPRPIATRNWKCSLVWPLTIENINSISMKGRRSMGRCTTCSGDVLLLAWRRQLPQGAVKEQAARSSRGFVLREQPLLSLPVAVNSSRWPSVAPPPAASRAGARCSRQPFFL
eukprot:6191931-Pleurochrysis_carterae.AAC.3